MSEFTYETVTWEDVPALSAQCDRFLTVGMPVDCPDPEKLESGDFSGVKALCDGELAGFMAMTRGVSFTCPRPALEEELLALTRGERVYTCDEFLVLPQFRRAGVGHGLAAHARRRLLELGARYYLCENWVYPDGGIPARSSYESMGTVVFQRGFSMFYTDLGEYGYRCSFCGPECKCGAWVQLIDLSAGNPAAIE